ncbi:MAG TPA: hypothetical protein VK154_20640 [Chitinophagales bacterium]|nr:hypothetical protein [Chitinophagales bacterium]
MKGKRLFELLICLNKTEHRQLVNQCKLSLDKRAADLLTLLNHRNLNDKVFEKILCNIKSSRSFKSQQEADKYIRRWIDYSCKEIEALIIKNTFSAPANRYHQLASHYDALNNSTLAHYYTFEAIAIAEAQDDHQTLIDMYDIQLRWLGRNQNKQNIRQIDALLGKRKKAAERAYHKAMSYFYTVCSSLYIDNPYNQAYIKITPDKQEFENLRNGTDDEYSQILYTLSEVRFSFYNKPVFERSIKNLFNQIASSGLTTKQKEYLERSCRYIRVIGGLYYGYSIDVMIADTERILDIMLKNRIYDTVSFFFLLFFLLIKNDVSRYNFLLNKYGTVFFSNTSNDYLLLLQVLKDYKTCNDFLMPEALQQASYSTNLYVAAWSKLLELATYKNSTRLHASLVKRIKRFNKLNNTLKIINHPLTILLECIDSKKNVSPAIFEYYQWVLQLQNK